MRITVSLNHKQFNKLYLTMSKSMSQHGNREFDLEKMGWEIIFNEDGTMEVWHGRYGTKDKEVN